MTARRFACWYLSVQAAGAAAWWATLLAWPPSRAYFKAAGAPDAALLAFGVADGLLFVAASAACARGLNARRPWAWPLLCAHAGAAGYAALYCLTLAAITGGDGWPGAMLMAPALAVPGCLAWRLRPTKEGGGAA